MPNDGFSTIFFVASWTVESRMLYCWPRIDSIFYPTISLAF